MDFQIEDCCFAVKIMSLLLFHFSLSSFIGRFSLFLLFFSFQPEEKNSFASKVCEMKQPLFVAVFVLFLNYRSVFMKQLSFHSYNLVRKITLTKLGLNWLICHCLAYKLHKNVHIVFVQVTYFRQRNREDKQTITKYNL